jgi:hypothetical protein
MLGQWMNKLLFKVLPPVVMAGLSGGEEYVHHFDVLSTVSCPCGSSQLHHLTLTNTADCRRCGKTFAIREIAYYRTAMLGVPEPHIVVGYVSEPVRN